MVSFFACVCLFPPMPRGEEKSLAGEEAGGESDEKFAGFPSMSPSDLFVRIHDDFSNFNRLANGHGLEL